MHLLKSYSLRFLLCACFALIGCTRPINRAAESRIRKALPEILGPAKRYEARVDSPFDRTLQGKLRNVAIDGEQVQLKNGLVIDHLHLDLKGVEVDIDRSTVKNIKETRFIATIGEKNLNEYVVDEILDGETLRDIKVSLTPNLITLSGKRVTLGIGIPFELSGPLKRISPTALELDSTRLRVVGIPLFGRVLEFLKRRFDSSVDLSHLPFPIQITEVQIEEGKLLLSGFADVAPFLQTAQVRRVFTH